MTKTHLLLAAAALTATAPLSAQALPAAVVAVVDTQRASNECTACKTASQQLQVQIDSLRARAQTLGAPLDAEGKAIEAAVAALNGKEADAALQKRYQTLQENQQKAQQELALRQQQVQRNQAYAGSQIDAALDPAITQVMQARGANIVVDSRATIRILKTVDITNEVIAALNAKLTSVSVTAPAAPAAAPSAAPAASTAPKTTPKKK